MPAFGPALQVPLQGGRVVVVVVVVGVPHTLAVHTPLQQLWFVLQRTPSALQRRSAVASRGAPTRSAPHTARSRRNDVGVIRTASRRGMSLSSLVPVGRLSR